MHHHLTDELDQAILMHKDAHFGGSFDVMLEYYEKEGKGIIEDFDLERIEQLAALEKQEGLSLSKELLSDDQKQEIEKALSKYRSLKEVYDLPPGLAHKIADLVFSEEIEPQQEIEALASTPEAVPFLLQIVKEDDFYNPLFPGYGFAPLHAIEALGLLKAKEAIIPLFEALSKTEFFGEEAVIHALFRIGEPAKEFLLNVLKKTPLTKENENAAIALLLFKDDPSVPSTCLNLLLLPEVQARTTLFTYLLLFCDALTDPEEKRKLKELSALTTLSKESKEELNWILKSIL